MWSLVRAALVSFMLLGLPVMAGCGQIACADSGCAHMVPPICATIRPPYEAPEAALSLTQADSDRRFTLVVGQVLDIKLPASAARQQDICIVGGEGLQPVSINQPSSAALTEVAFRAVRPGFVEIRTLGADGMATSAFSVAINVSRPTPVCTPRQPSGDRGRAAAHVTIADYHGTVRLTVGQVVTISLPTDYAHPGDICYQPEKYGETVLEPVSIAGSTDASMTAAAFVATRPGSGEIVSLREPPPRPGNCFTCPNRFTMTVDVSPSPSPSS